MGNTTMDKLKMESVDITQKNIEKIAALFPNVITEMRDENGKLKKGINFELLKQELSHDVIDGEECYDFTWVGKKAAIVEGNTPIRETLRPCIEESKDFENTENLYIEGDNLDVLKLLQESYLNSIKMIYIDPPYNTGNDFIYKDNFTMDKDEYDEEIGLYDEEQNRLFKNNENRGRFHSDWCSMMYPRLKLAQNLLREDGVIFISIDDNEVDNLKKLCDEIFGEDNFLSTICVKMSHLSGMKMSHKDKKIPKIKEFIIMYCKNKNNISLNPIYIPGKWDSVFERYKKFVDKDREVCEEWKVFNLSQILKQENLLNEDEIEEFNIRNASNIFRTAVNDSFKDMIKDNKFHRVITKTGLEKYVYNSEEVIFASSKLQKFDGKLMPAETIGDIWTDIGINNLYNEGEVNFPNGKKPLKLIKRLIKLISNKDSEDIILDFFSGSATTAHATMQLNLEDNGKRKFIMVQLPEICDVKSEMYKAGYKNICEIGKERIRRSGEKIKSENSNAKDLDIGFRVLKLDSTNMKDVYYSASEYTQDMLAGLESNIKEDRTDLDLLYGALLDWGLPLSLSHKMEEVDGVTVHTVDNGSLIACFAEKVSEKIVREIAKRQPLRVVFRDSSFKNSPDKINVEEIFKLLAPNTSVKVI